MTRDFPACGPLAFTKSELNLRYIPTSLNLHTNLIADHILHIICKTTTSHMHASTILICRLLMPIRLLSNIRLCYTHSHS